MNFVEEISFFSMCNANLMILTNLYSFKFPANFVMVAFVAFLSDFAKTQGNACIRIFLHFFMYSQIVSIFLFFFGVFLSGLRAFRLLTPDLLLNTHKDRWSSLKINKTSRSSRPEVFCKKGVLKNFAKFTRKHLYQSHFFNKVAGLKKETLEQVFSCEFC